MSGVARVRLLVTVTAILGSSLLLYPSAQAHSSNDAIGLFTPLRNGDSGTRWGFSGDSSTVPPKHHVIYSNWGVRNDWSADIFAPPGRRIVSPFAVTTSNGHSVRVHVAGSPRSGCRSGKIADGGYRVTLEARDKKTGAVIARADIMHVNRPQVSSGQVIGKWTTIGYTARFRNNSCYQVTNDRGVHTHFEAINRHRYSCYVRRSAGTVITESTRIGRVGDHYSSTRAC